MVDDGTRSTAVVAAPVQRESCAKVWETGCRAGGPACRQASGWAGRSSRFYAEPGACHGCPASGADIRRMTRCFGMEIKDGKSGLVLLQSPLKHI